MRPSTLPLGTERVADTGPVVEVRGLTRRFGGRRAVDEVSFTLGAGECLALFGPNGAGKTTLLRMLAGLLKPTSGTARIGGMTVPGGGATRAAVGLISHEHMLYDALTARENVEFTARLYGVRDPRAAATSALERIRMLDRADAAVRSLSRGMQQRVSIARAMVHGPQVVLLDEPFTGLDAAGAAALTAMLCELEHDGASLILVTHNLAEGLELATHAAIMRAGRLVRYEACATLDPGNYTAAYRELVANGP
jgi:heme exporter protein A